MSFVYAPIFQIGLAAANATASTLLFKESKGEKPLYALAGGTLAVFTGWHIWQAICLLRGEEAHLTKRRG